VNNFIQSTIALGCNSLHIDVDWAQSWNALQSILKWPRFPFLYLSINIASNKVWSWVQNQFQLF